MSQGGLTRIYTLIFDSTITTQLFSRGPTYSQADTRHGSLAHDSSTSSASTVQLRIPENVLQRRKPLVLMQTTPYDHSTLWIFCCNTSCSLHLSSLICALA
ncbi:hypothetical protein GBAR_LOCUS24213 [Geodia barretti]|uniref:Uncharacterized protein n=1 Tax=Geodia barretti TaxID=519541 RepID=A0AA35T9C8_GEOBA|nr:hypothetical protein GBAR_LOCUS24213 [Geodia barretti]